MGIPQLSAADTANLSLSASSVSRDQNKVRENAIEFEAMLIGQVMEKLQHTFASTDDQGSDPAHDTVSSLGTHAIAQLLAQRHAFGMAEMLQRAVLAGENTTAPPK